MHEHTRTFSRRGLLACAIAALTSVTHAQQTWQPLPTGVSDAIYGMHFRDADNGAAVGWGVSKSAVILQTADGGATWRSSIAVPRCFLFSIVFVDSQLGVAVGQDRNVQKGLVLRTTDGGQTWTPDVLQETFGLYEVQFPTPTLGFTCGYNGAVFRTTDAGVSWQRVGWVPREVFRSMTFVSPTVGFALGGGAFSSQRVYSTDDGGVTWTLRYSNGGATLAALSFADEQTGIVVGNIGGRRTVLRTADGGLTWSEAATGGATVPQAAYMTGLSGWTVGSTVLRTCDAGANWRSVPAPPAGILLSVFESEGVVYVGGTSGAIYKWEAGAACAFRNGGGTNPTGFVCDTIPALGTVWRSTIPTTPDTLATWIGIAVQPGRTALGPGEILIGLGPPAPLFVAGTGSHGVTIPGLTDLCGASLATQGFRVDRTGGAPVLVTLNAQDLTLGL